MSGTDDFYAVVHESQLPHLLDDAEILEEIRRCIRDLGGSIASTSTCSAEEKAQLTEKYSALKTLLGTSFPDKETMVVDAVTSLCRCIEGLSTCSAEEKEVLITMFKTMATAMIPKRVLVIASDPVPHSGGCGGCNP